MDEEDSVEDMFENKGGYWENQFGVSIICKKKPPLLFAHWCVWVGVCVCVCVCVCVVG